jgi:2-hydroxy-6-oxonona-2,4-dienedioate hydrolase
MWQRVIGPLATHFSVITVDLPGFGDSECPQKHYLTGDYVTILHHLLLELRIAKAQIVGVSYGGQVAVEYAARHPENVELLVLIASTGLSHRFPILISSPVWSVFATIAKNTLLRSRHAICFLGRSSFHDVASRPSDLCAKFYRQISRPGCREAWMSMLRSVLSEDHTFRKKLGDLRVPTLLLWGESDRSVPLRFAREFQQLIPSSQLQAFPLCAHSVPLEKPQEMCAAIVRFVPGR